MAVRSRIKELRMARKLTQAELAKLIDSDQSRVSLLENDATDITATEIDKLRRVFKIKAWELFSAPESEAIEASSHGAS